MKYGACIAQAPHYQDFRSGFAHAWHRLGCRVSPHLLFDTPSYLRIDVAPVLEGALQHRAAHTTEQAAGYLVDQFGAFLIVEHFTYQRARLAEVIILGV